MNDLSMIPELRMDDILIIDANLKLHPGSLVVAKLYDGNEVIIRRYKQLTLSKEFSPFELCSDNDHRGNIKVSKISEGIIIGVIVCIVRRIER